MTWLELAPTVIASTGSESLGTLDTVDPLPCSSGVDIGGSR